MLVVVCISLLSCGPMPYQVLPLTHHQIANGVLQPFRDLGIRSQKRRIEIENQQGRPPVQQCQIEVFFLDSTVDRAAFEPFRVRFGDDLANVLFFNERAVRACQDFRIPLHTVGQIANAELPPITGIVLNCPYFQ